MNVAFETLHPGNAAGKDEWLTPPEVVRSLGTFDLDPCAPINRPWDTARQHYTIRDDGLTSPWFGRVYCNPPYGRQTGRWLERCAHHGNAIALIFARTDTQAFHRWVWNRADALLFLDKRLMFYHVSGERGSDRAGAPSVLVAYGSTNVDTLRSCSIPGKFIFLSKQKSNFMASDAR